MPRTLRRHVEEAEKIVSVAGVKTLIPQKGLPAPIKVDAGNRQLEYATDVRVIVERYDRTGYAGDFLRAADDLSGEAWSRIPEHPVCPLCLGRVPADRGKGRALCTPCEAYVKPKSLRGLVSADIRKMREALREGGIGVE